MLQFTRFISLFLSLWLGCSLPATAQNPVCGSDELMQQKRANDPVFRQLEEQLEIQRYKQVQEKDKSGGIPDQLFPAYTIPVVVHIIHQNGSENITDAQVQQGIQHLNAAFANTGYYDNGNGVATPFQFCLARKNPDGTATTGINRIVSTLTTMVMDTQDLALKNLIRWDPTQYVNIWLVKEISSLSIGTGVAGYAYFPNSHGNEIDGIVMEAQWLGATPATSAILVHEMGHYLGLYHTFEGGCTNNNCALEGDRVCDTPPDQSTANSPCGTIQNSCSTDVNSGFTSDQNDMTINYMDYATIACYNAFTQGQSDRMEFFLLGARKSLLESEGCKDPCNMPLTAAFSASAGSVLNVGTTVNFTNMSVNGSAFEWFVDGVSIATTQNAVYTFSTVGQHLVSLRVTSADLNCLKIAKDTFVVICPTQADFNISPAFPALGYPVLFSSTSSAANALDWTVNGVSLSTATNWSFVLPAPGVYTVCLTATGDFCLDNFCQNFEVTDTIPCRSSFQKRIDYGNNRLFLGGFQQLPGGDLLACGIFNFSKQYFIRFSPEGDIVQHWSITPQNTSVPVSDLHYSQDGFVLATLSAVSGGSYDDCVVEKINYNTNQPVWIKNLTCSQPLFIWNIREHPVTQNYWAFGRATGTANQAPTDKAILLEMNPANGNVLSQRNYSIGEVPFVKASVAIGNFIYGAGYGYTNATGSTPMLAKFDLTGAVVWSKKYDFAPLAFVQWTDIARDGNDLVLAGANGTTIFFMRTDINGNPLAVKSYSPGQLNFFSHADMVNISVVPDGYVLTFALSPGVTEDQMVFLKTDKNGVFNWVKATTLATKWDGEEVLVQNDHLYAVTAQGFAGDDLYLIKTPLQPSDTDDCVREVFTLDPSVPNFTVTTLSPAPVSGSQINTVTLNSTQQALNNPIETLCTSAFCPEICNNGLDDDFDGYVDCYDVEDCPCDLAPPCADTLQIPNIPISAQEDWVSPGDMVWTTWTPVVGNLNPKQEDIPEIVMAQFELGLISDKLFIFRGDGVDAAAPKQLIIPEKFAAFLSTTPAIGDVDGNGIPELIMLCADRRIRVYTNYDPNANPVMSLMAVSQDLTGLNPASKPLLADFNGDGFAEIYVGNEVFQFDFSVPGNPSLRLAVSGLPGPSGRESHDNLSSCSIAVDLLQPADCGGDPDCAGLEIAAGYAIYSIDLNPFDGDPVEIKKQRDLSAFPPFTNYGDGQTTVGDVDLDGVLDVIVTGRRAGTFGAYVWNKFGLIRFFPLPTFGSSQTGLAAVGNVYNDKLSGATVDFPEIMLYVREKVIALNLNAAAQTPATPWWWALPISDGAGFNSVSLFDFNNDGFAETVVRDVDSLRILYGGPAPFPPGVAANRNWFGTKITSITQDEYPVIADVDNDGQAEIVLAGRLTSPPSTNTSNVSLMVVEGPPVLNAPWMPARKLWNQYNYYPVAINDDLTIPKNQQSSHLEFPGLGSGKRPFNIFLGQMALLDQNFDPYLPLPDASVSVAAPTCMGDSITLNLQICNQGSALMPAGTPIRLYNGDPTTSNAMLLPEAHSLPQDIAPDSCFSFEINLALPVTGQSIYLIVNDNGSIPPPFNLASDFPVNALAECNYLNNIASFPLPPAVPMLDLGPNIAVCQNGVWSFNAGAGFQAYQWSTLSVDSVITVYGPGTYWVEAKDICGNLYRDSVTVSVDVATVFELGADTLLCGNGSLQFNVSGFAEYHWYPAGDLSCTNCGNPVAQPTGDKTYTLVAKTALGCLSTDSIHVAMGEVVEWHLDTATCLGGAVTLYGVTIPVGGSQVFTFPSATGCDSILTVSVDTLPTFQTTENQAICAGDSAFIFNQWQHQAGVYSQTFSAAGGCDSTHTVTLQVVLTFQTSENRSICAGDSSLVFNQWQHQAGVYSQIFATAGGCDSTHTVSLQVAPTFQTSENRSICAGDSSLIFNQWQHQAGVFSQTFAAAGGCDSTHTVTLNVAPTFQTSESRSICAGDSSLIFNQWQHQAGVFSQIFAAAGGCDSTHTVTLQVVPTFQTSESRSICAGDSSLIFNQWQHQAGVYSQIFAAAGGCDSTHTVTLQIAPTFQTSESRSICAGDSSLIFNQWQHQAGVYSQVFATAGGCDSTHTVTLQIAPTFQTSESRSICAGDSSLIFNQWQHQAGVYSQIFAAAGGCDSTHTVTLQVASTFQTFESRSICMGDSSLIFNQWQHQAGVYSQIYATAGGCDSTHTVSLQVASTFQTSESRSICMGDSSLIFNQWQHQAGVYSQIYATAGGCDSTHTVSLQVASTFQTSETSESRSICMGDSSLIFNQWQHQAGVYSQVFAAAGGCDSTHTVTLQIAPTFQTSESRSICAGDSSLIFNQWQHQAGVYSQIFAAAGGCDSTHTVTLQVAPTFQTSESRSICVGDSSLIFNQWQHQAGVYSQTFAAAGGCDSVHTILLEQLSGPILEFDLSAPLCFGDSTGSLGMLTAASGLAYSLDGVHFQIDPIFEGLTAGEYPVWIQDAAGCIYSDTVELTAPLPLFLQLPGDTVLQLGETLELHPITSAGALTYNWLPPTFLNCANCANPVSTPSQSILYTLVVEDNQGCAVSDSIAILVEEKTTQIFVPTIFSPNGDGLNEILGIYAPFGVREVRFMEIYDRWGSLIFRQEHFAADGAVGWDGRMDGKPLLPGVYVWVLEIELEDGATLKKRGDVTLIN